MRRTAEPGFPRASVPAWMAARSAARLASRWWLSLRVEGEEVPPGPVVVAANHFSHLDPVVVGIAVDRPIRYLAVDELYGNSRFFDSLTLRLGAIPMSRTRIPFGPLKLALSELTAGRTIGLFPEGVRVWGWGERAPKRGAAWLSARAGVPLVPVAVEGTDLAMGRGSSGISRARVRVTVCPAISPHDHAASFRPVDDMTAEWVRRIDQALTSN